MPIIHQNTFGSRVLLGPAEGANVRLPSRKWDLLLMGGRERGERVSDEVLVSLSVWSEVQIAYGPADAAAILITPCLI